MQPCPEMLAHTAPLSGCEGCRAPAASLQDAGRNAVVCHQGFGHRFHYHKVKLAVALDITKQILSCRFFSLLVASLKTQIFRKKSLKESHPMDYRKEIHSGQIEEITACSKGSMTNCIVLISWYTIITVWNMITMK